MPVNPRLGKNKFGVNPMRSDLQKLGYVDVEGLLFNDEPWAKR
jgi:hypothetical protein